MNYNIRVSMLDSEEALTIRHQARLLDVSRSSFYYNFIINNDTEVANIIVEIYSKSDCRYGYRKVHDELRENGVLCNKKKTQRIMRELGLQGIYPKKKCNTTIADKENKIYLYLLKDLEIMRINQVWTSDITYIWVAGRFMYFIAIIDLYSRYIVASGLNHSLEGDFCVFILNLALEGKKPEIFNTDQGSQYTSKDFTGVLVSQNIRISMAHKGRCFDNIHVERLWRTIKQEAIYYYKPENIVDLEKVLVNFVSWYNNERKHQSLNYRRPAEIYNCKEL